MSEPQVDLQNPKSKSKEEKQDILKNWAYIIFVTCCSISFYVALVLALDFPLKFALLLGLIPVGAFLAFLILFFCVFKCDFNKWREIYGALFMNESYTRAIKAVLLPLLLVGLYFYIKEEENANVLYATSPVSCDQIIHPCGSSVYKDTSDVWDAADLISQVDNEVFILTNTVGLNQSRGICGQTGAYCSTNDINPGRRIPTWLRKTGWTFSHQLSRSQIWNPVQCPEFDEFDPPTSTCESGVLYDNGIQREDCDESNSFCNIAGWCPPIKLNDFSLQQPTFRTEDFTIFLDLKPNFPEFRGVSWSKGGEAGYSANYAEIYAKYYSYSRSVSSCLYDPEKDPLCPRFRLKDIVTLVDGDSNYDETAIYGGMFKIEIEWNCKFDWGKDIFDCLPKFRFLNRSTNKGKPKIFPKITSQIGNNRTVTFSLGINVAVTHVGIGQQIQIYSLVLYAQFVFVSFQMIKGPFVWLVRCLIATILTIKEKLNGN